MKLEVKIDAKRLQEMAKKANKTIEQNLPKISSKGASSYADNAAMFVPPKVNGTFKKTIPNKLYKRQIKDIRKTLEKLRKFKSKAKKNKNEKAIKKANAIHTKIINYVDALSAGYKYMIRGVKNFKPKTFYFKTKQIANKYKKITTRGLLKVMFGANLLKFNNIPKSIQTLLDKSPDLKKFVSVLNPILKQNKEKQSTMTLTNKAGNISDSLTHIAMDKGKRFALGTMKVQAQLLVKKVCEQFK